MAPNALQDPTTPSPLAIPIFRAVWIASLFSNFGGLIQSVGASWTMTTLSPSPVLVALVQSSTTLPIMLLSLWSGAIADNLDRRLVMIFAQSFMLVISMALTTVAWFGLLTPWLLLVFTFAIGCGTALNAPAWQASVGEMVPRPVLPAAVAYNSMGFNVARSVGPAIGGGIVAIAGAAAAFLVNAFSYLGLIAVLLKWRPLRPENSLPRESIGAAMRAGVRYVIMSPSLRTVMGRAVLFGTGAAGVPALMPLVARHLIAGGAIGYGLLLGAFGIGAVMGALGSQRLRAQFSSEMLIRFGALALGASAIVIALSSWLVLSGLALVVAGAGWLVTLSTFNVTVQLATPRWVVARALAIYQMMAFGGMAIGSWLFGWIAEDFSIEVSLMATAAVTIVGAAAGLIRPMPDLESANLDPLGRWREPQTAIPVEPRSGPVVIMIEYRIHPDNEDQFLHAIAERRRIRLRDGAKGWALQRDLADPEIWIERYHVPTWLDYVRHNQRRTQADAENSKLLSVLSYGNAAPKVRRLLERGPNKLLYDSHVDFLEPMTDATRTN